MRKSVVIVDNFFKDPESLVRYANTLSYINPYQDPLKTPPDQKSLWMSSKYLSAKACPLKSSQWLIESLELATGDKIDRENWNLDFPVDDRGYPVEHFASIPPWMKSAWWNCTFHAKLYDKQVIGEGVHDHTDYDTWNSVGDDGWVGLVYLNKDAPLQSGLRTWRNLHNSNERFTDPSRWELMDTFANIPNRLILHRGKQSHSGAAGWGSNFGDSRIYLTIFARIKTQQAGE